MSFDKNRLKRMKSILDKKAQNNTELVNSWILGKPKNAYYTPNDTSPITKNDDEYYALLDWIIPNEEFKYREINKQTEKEFIKEYCDVTNYKLKRSSIIPFVNRNGENCWLLGSFHDYEKTKYPILADFAGSCEEKDKNDCAPLNCAMRELNEESKGLLPNIVRNAIRNSNNFVIFEGKNTKGDILYFMFVKLNYEDVKDIPDKFSKIKEIKGQEKFGPLRFYRQSDILNREYRTSKNLTDLVSMLKE